ncbi:hypothetical protein GCM10010277_52640 [Streptomyces longisporoflavus]|nr:hypothetical protein GCM10010277_52640 [Streptomyces longisporoflavus]
MTGLVTGFAAGAAREPQPRGGDENGGYAPHEPRMRVMRRPGHQPLEGLVVDDPRLADAARLEDPVGPEVDAGGRQRERAECDGACEGGHGGRPFAYAPGEEQIRDEDRRSELDPGGDADREAFADGAGGPGQIPEDQAGQSEIDLPEHDRLEDGFEPEGEGGPGDEGREAGGKPGEAAGEMDENREQPDVPHDEGELERGEGKPGGRYEEDGGERRIRGRKIPLRHGEPVEIPPVDHGGAFGPVDEGVGHGDALSETEDGERGERNEKKSAGSRRHRHAP